MTHTRTLNVLAALLWYGGALSLLFKGTALLFRAERINSGQVWPWMAFAIGITVGALKARFILYTSCQKNLRRIADLESPKWWQFYRPIFFVALALMIMLGLTLSRLAEGHYTGWCAVDALEISIGTGLFLSGVAFYKVEPFSVLRFRRSYAVDEAIGD